LEYVDDLGENVIKGHDRYSAVGTAALLRRSMPQNREEGKGTNSVYYRSYREPMPLYVRGRTRVDLPCQST